MADFKINATSFSDLMSEKYPENRWMIEQLVPEEGIVVLSGASGSFKTWLIMEMALAIAEGRDFLDMFRTEQSKVLIIDEENGKRLYNERFKKITTSLEAPIFLSSMEGFVVNNNNVNNVIEFCEKEQIRLVIIDSMTRVNTGDENSSKDIAKFFASLRDFTRHLISVILIHHNRKPGVAGYDAGTDMRGSSDIRAAIDIQLAVRRPGTSMTIELRQSKCRYNQENPPIKLAFEKNDETGLIGFRYIGALKDKENDNRELEEELKNVVLEMVGNFPNTNKGAIAATVANKTGRGASKVKAIISELVESGELVSTTGKYNATLLNLPSNLDDDGEEES